MEKDILIWMSLIGSWIATGAVGYYMGFNHLLYLFQRHCDNLKVKVKVVKNEEDSE